MQLIIKYPDFTLGSYFTCERERNSGHWYVSFVWTAHLAMRFDLSEFRKIQDTIVTGVRICGHYGYQPKGKIAKVGLASVPYADRQAVPINGDFDVNLGTALPEDGDLSVIASYETATQIISDGRAANGYQLNSSYSPPRYYTFVPVSSVRLIIEYESATTACTPPTELMLDRAIAEDTAIMSWSGAEGGTGNEIEGYPIQYRDSADGETWGDWTDMQTVAESPATVAPNPERGAYRQYRVCAQGTAGVPYRSGWITSAVLRTNTAPGKPGPVIPDQTVVEGETVGLSWTPAAGGLSAVAGYRVERQVAGGDWELLTAFVDGLSYQASMQGVDRGESVLFRVRAVDVLGGASAWVYSAEVFKNRVPPIPVIVWPADGSICMAAQPLIAVRADADPDGQEMTIESQTGEGTWSAARLPKELPFPLGQGVLIPDDIQMPDSEWTPGATLSADGNRLYIFRLPSVLEDGKAYYVRLRFRDSLGATGDYAYINIGRISEGTWTRNIARGRVISGPIVHHTDDLRELLTVVNARLAWCKVPPIEYDTELGWFANWLPQMQQLWNALAKLYVQAGETVDSISQDGNYPTAATVNLIRSMCEGL